MQKEIGILFDEYPPLAYGSIKNDPYHFIVQELLGEDRAEFCPTFDNQVESNSEFHLATLVKCGLSTQEAIHRIASFLSIQSNQLSFAGRKDTEAYTAQFVGIRGAYCLPTSWPEELSLHSIRPWPSFLRLGDHSGNYFKVTVKVANLDPQAANRRMEQIQQRGFINYFDSQRFGPRQNNHHIGELLLKSKWEEACFFLLTDPGKCPSKDVLLLRQKAAELWPDYASLYQLFLPYSHPLRSELAMLKILQSGGEASDFIQMITPQARFFINAYGSYLFNALLSSYRQFPPFSLPTISKDPEVIAMYAQRLNLDLDFLQKDPIPSLKLVSHSLSCRVKPTNFTIQVNSEEKNVIVEFSLPKAAYATTLLRTIFSLNM